MEYIGVAEVISYTVTFLDSNKYRRYVDGVDAIAFLKAS